MKLLTELTTDFSRGMLDDLAATRYPNNVAREIRNGRVQPDGSVLPRDGSIRMHASPIIVDGIGYEAIEFVTAGGTVQLITFVDDKFYVSTNGGVSSADNTGLNVLSANYYSLAIMRVGATNYLFAANGAGSVWRWNGATLDALPGAPAGVKYLAVFNGRLYATGHSGVLVQASAIGDPTTWTSPDGLTIQVVTHDGSDTPTGLYQVGPHLLVFDSNSTSYIDGFGEATLIVEAGAQGFSRSVGCIAFRTIRGVGENAICWLSQRGIEYYSANTGIRLLTSPGLQTFFSTINRAAIKSNPGRPSGVYDAVTQEYLCALSSTGVQNDRVVVINLLQRGTNWLGAPTVDQISAASTASLILFGEDAEGYLTEDVGGVSLHEDDEGYASLAALGDAILPSGEDAFGYLETAISNDLGATLFIASDAIRGSAVHSLGYDGYIRKHYGVDQDDVISDGSNGIERVLRMISRPFLFGSSHQTKMVRVIHVQTIQDADAEVQVSVIAEGVAFREHTLTMRETAFDQPQHSHAKVWAKGAQPQVILETSDTVRVAALGLSAEPQRDLF